MPRSRAEPPRLVRRVALAGAAWAAVAGACAALFAALLTLELVERHEDRTLLYIAEELADEVDEELDRGAPDDPPDDPNPIVLGPDGRPVLASVLRHELADVKQPGAVAAIVDAQRIVAGDEDLPILEPGICVVVHHRGTDRRVCAAALTDGRWVSLGISAEDALERRRLMAWSLLAGAVFGAAIGGLASHRSASWTIAPVTALGDRVRRIDAEAPRPELLEPPASHAEIEELRAAIAQLVSRLGDALTHAQSFAAHAAHELRTPLAVLAGELELMIEGDPVDPASLRRVRARVQELVRLVQRLLVLAELGHRAMDEGEPIDLSDVIEAARADLGPEHAARLRVDIGEDVVVSGDFELLRSLVHNAIENAMKFSTGRVDVAVRKDDEATIDVIDDGPGIRPADREAVFAPFHRGARHRSAAVPGHGIGLALIARVAEAHGGQARFLEVDRGAHLRVRLPLWRPPSARRPV